MSATMKMSAITEEMVEDLARQIEMETEVTELSLQQFILDVLNLNFNVDRDSYTKLTIAVYLGLYDNELVVSQLTSLPSWLCKKLSNKIEIKDCYKVIVNIINEYREEYTKFASGDKYKQSNIRKSKTMHLKSSDVRSVLSNSEFMPAIVDFYELGDVLSYNDDLYKRSVRHYLKSTFETGSYKHINYKKIKKKSLFPKLFDTKRCSEVVNDLMGDEIEKLANSRIDKYRLLEKKNQEAYNCEFKRDSDAKPYPTEVIDRTKVIDMRSNPLNIEELHNVIKYLYSTDQETRYDYINFEYNTISIEINKHDYTQIQVTAKKFEKFKVALEIEEVLIQSLSKLNSVFKPQPKLDKLDFTIEGLQGRKIEIANKRLALIFKQDKVKMKNSDYLAFIPLFDKQKKQDYIEVLHHDEACIRFDVKEFKLLLRNVEKYDYRLLKRDVTVGFDAAQINVELPGNLDAFHYLKLLDIVFVYQYLHIKSSHYDYVISINVGDNVFIEVQLLTNECNVKIIDPNAVLGYEREMGIENDIKAEVVHQAKIIKKYEKTIRK